MREYSINRLTLADVATLKQSDNVELTDMIAFRIAANSDLNRAQFREPLADRQMRDINARRTERGAHATRHN